ncbi:MAG TPA: hypothetical protein VEA19_01530 [Actinomycetota bacterium]|nr:hypothetical protein [Actinomycetota bacterium]
MEFRRVIRKRIHRDEEGVQVDGDVNAVISVNVGDDGSSTSTSSHQRIVQRSGPGSRRRKDDGEEVTKDG